MVEVVKDFVDHGGGSRDAGDAVHRLAIGIADPDGDGEFGCISDRPIIAII